MPTRWKVDVPEDNRKPCCILEDEIQDGYTHEFLIAKTGNSIPGRAYAAQIVREHNAHEAMREALKAADLFMQRFEDERGSCEVEAHTQVKAALRLAKGG